MFFRQKRARGHVYLQIVENRWERRHALRSALHQGRHRGGVVRAQAGFVQPIGETKATIARTLAQLADRLEEEIGKYGQICRAIAAKDAELQEIYEIERSASTLLAIMETQQRQQEEMEREFQTEKEQLESEITVTRAEWEKERKDREQEVKERDAAEQKRRQREAEEYKYNFAREQQLAQDRLNDALVKGEKELSERKTQLERDWGEREKAIASP